MKRNLAVPASCLRLIFAMATLAAAIMPLPAAAATPPPCERPTAGSAVLPPPDLYSANGVLPVALQYKTSIDSAGNARFCFLTPDGQQAPTLHVKPGDVLRIKFTNAVPPPPASAPTAVMSDKSNRCGSARMTLTSANIHFHGTNTTPTCHSDEVIHTLVNSGESFTYTVKIPKDEPPGLYWYHPHVHGLSEAAVLGGASGVIEVEGIANFQPSVRGLPERYLVLRDQLVANAQVQHGPPVPAWDISLNYVPVLYPAYKPAMLHMAPGGREFWRVTNAAAGTVFDLEVLYDGKPQPVLIVAFDGVPLGSQNKASTSETRTDVLLPPASRAEFIVTGPRTAVRSAFLVTRAVDTGPAGDLDPERPLARIISTVRADSPHALLESVPLNPQRFAGLAEAKVTATRKLYFSEIFTPSTNPDRHAGNPRWDENGITRFFITVDGNQPMVFNPDNPPAITTRQGAVEDWTIENRSKEVHAFHMHQIHFLLLAVNGVPVPKSQQQFYDTYPIDFWKGKGQPYPKITVRMDFRGPVVGDFVYHCHILEHEDNGMMAIIRVLPRSASLEKGAASEDGQSPWRRALADLYRRIAIWRLPPQTPSGASRFDGARGGQKWTFPAKCLSKLAH